MRPCHTLVHAALIVTQDEERTVLENASMAVLDGLVADIGPRHEVASRWQPEQDLHQQRSGAGWHFRYRQEP